MAFSEPVILNRYRPIESACKSIPPGSFSPTPEDGSWPAGVGHSRFSSATFFQFKPPCERTEGPNTGFGGVSVKFKAARPGSNAFSIRSGMDPGFKRSAMPSPESETPRGSESESGPPIDPTFGTSPPDRRPCPSGPVETRTGIRGREAGFSPDNVPASNVTPLCSDGSPAGDTGATQIATIPTDNGEPMDGFRGLVWGALSNSFSPVVWRPVLIEEMRLAIGTGRPESSVGGSPGVPGSLPPRDIGGLSGIDARRSVRTAANRFAITL